MWAKASFSSGRNNVLDSLKTTELWLMLPQLLAHSQGAGAFVLCDKLDKELQVWYVNGFQKCKETEQTPSAHHSCICNHVEICTAFHWELCWDFP